MNFLNKLCQYEFSIPTNIYNLKHSLLKNNNFTNITINEYEKYALLNTFNNKVYSINYGKLELFLDTLNYLNLDIPINYQNYYSLSKLLLNNISYLFLAYLFLKLVSKSFKISNHNYQNFKKTDYPKLEDVIGMENIKIEITKYITIFMNSEDYLEKDIKIPTGLLLSGPPGNGKTFLSKAIANTFGLNFFYISGSEFNTTFVGIGTVRIKELFRVARERAPSIIFIDEIDAIGKKRSKENLNNNEDRENTLNTLLVELDGFNKNTGVLVLGATNMVEVLDHALTRPGRFNKTIEIRNPNNKARKLILNQFLKKKSEMSYLLADKYSYYTRGFSISKLEELCNESVILSVNDKLDFIDDIHFEQALDIMLLGYPEPDLINDKTLQRIAYHESGHALVAILLKNTNNPLKVSILPRSKGMLGFSQTMITEDVLLETDDDLVEQMKVLIGGRCAEYLIYSNYSTGASDDLEKLNKLAYQYITYYGMGTPKNIISHNYENNYKLDSNMLQKDIDIQIKQLITKITQETEILLRNHLTILKMITTQLISQKTIYYYDLKIIVDNNLK